MLLNKLTLAVAAFSTLSIGAIAQTGIRFGPEAGINLTNNWTYTSSKQYTYTVKPGLKIGGLVDIRLSDHWYLQPGVFFNQKGSRISPKVIMNLNYLDIPVDVAYKLGEHGDTRFFAFAGPDLGIGLYGKYRQSGPDADIHFGYGKRDDFQMLELGANAGLGCELSNGLFAKVQYGQSVLSISRSSRETFINWGFGLSVGYLFGGK